MFSPMKSDRNDCSLLFASKQHYKGGSFGAVYEQNDSRTLYSKAGVQSLVNTRDGYRSIQHASSGFSALEPVPQTALAESFIPQESLLMHVDFDENLGIPDVNDFASLPMAGSYLPGHFEPPLASTPNWSDTQPALYTPKCASKDEDINLYSDSVGYALVSLDKTFQNSRPYSMPNLDDDSDFLSPTITATPNTCHGVNRVDTQPKFAIPRCPNAASGRHRRRLHHKNETMVKCTVLGCEKRFVGTKERTRHLNDVHGQGSKSTALCGRSMRKDNISRHEKACELCNLRKGEPPPKSSWSYL